MFQQYILRILTSLAWLAGDKVFDHFINVKTAEAMRVATEKRWQAAWQKNEQWQPTTKWGKWWKEHERQGLESTKVYLRLDNTQWEAEEAAHGEQHD